MNTPIQVTHSNPHSMDQPISRDDEIVSAARGGCPKAFAELHAIYSRRLYSTIFAITKSREDAEDALQETFLRAYLAISTFEGRSTIYSWLTRIAINSALMVLQKRRTRAEMLFDHGPDDFAERICFEFKDPAPNPEQVCDWRQRGVGLVRSMRKLSPQLQEPIQLRMAKGFSLKQISQELNISVGAVKARLHRARRRLSAANILKCTRNLEPFCKNNGG